MNPVIVMNQVHQPLKYVEKSPGESRVRVPPRYPGYSGGGECKIMEMEREGRPHSARRWHSRGVHSGTPKYW